MARPTAQLIAALRETVARLHQSTATYRWSSFAFCNCGHLAQTLTHVGPAELQRLGQQGEGDWGAKAVWARNQQSIEESLFPQEGAWQPETIDRCGATGTPLDAILRTMFAAGLAERDIADLERLSNNQVRLRLGVGPDFVHYEKENVIRYLGAWADLLEEELELSRGSMPLAAE